MQKKRLTDFVGSGQTSLSKTFWQPKFLMENYHRSETEGPQCSKSTGSEQPVEDIPNFTRIFVYLFICVTPPDQAKKDTGLKFGTHTLIDLI